MMIQAIIGHVDRIFHDQATGLTKPITAQAEKGVTMPLTATPTLTDSDLRQAVADGLRRKFRKVSPTGQEIGEVPIVEDVVRESGTGQPEVVYRFGGQFWKAPFLINPDRTVTVGEGVPVARNWTVLSGAQHGALEQAVAEMYRPWMQPGDAPPRIVEIRAQAAPLSRPTGRVIVGFKSEHASVPYTFDSPTGPCWVTMGTLVERKGSSSFQAPSTATGLEIDKAAKFLQRVMADRGKPLSYGEAMLCASKHLGGVPDSEKPAITKFLGLLLNSFEKKGGV